MYELLIIHVIAFVQATLWGVTLQTSDQIPSPVDWEWKYSKGKEIALDWCGAYDVNLNDYIFPALAKYFASDANVWRKEFYVFHFVVAFAFHKET